MHGALAALIIPMRTFSAHCKPVLNYCTSSEKQQNVRSSKFELFCVYLISRISAGSIGSMRFITAATTERRAATCRATLNFLAGSLSSHYKYVPNYHVIEELVAKQHSSTVRTTCTAYNGIDVSSGCSNS